MLFLFTFFLVDLMLLFFAALLHVYMIHLYYSLHLSSEVVLKSSKLLLRAAGLKNTILVPMLLV